MLVITIYGTSCGSFSVSTFNCIFGIIIIIIVVVIIAIIVVVALVLCSILTINDSSFG